MYKKTLNLPTTFYLVSVKRKSNAQKGASLL